MTPVGKPAVSLDAYEKAGGFKGAINQDAEDVFVRFRKERLAIQRLFQRITERGDGDKPIRRPETISTLSDITGLPARRLQDIVDAFVQRGLLASRPLENGELEVDLPHECVAWKWERLSRWMGEE